jgi:thiosulfate dehydrogenase [quinone] large subunit
VNCMVLVRLLVGALWLNGALEKFLNPDFPQQFATSLQSGGYISQAPLWFQSFMQSTVAPHAELFANLTRFGQLALGIALVLGLLTNLAAIGSIFLITTLQLSQGALRLGTGLASPEFLTIHVIVAVLALSILLSASAKALSLDCVLARRKPALNLLLMSEKLAAVAAPAPVVRAQGSQEQGAGGEATS